MAVVTCVPMRWMPFVALLSLSIPSVANRDAAAQVAQVAYEVEALDLEALRGKVVVLEVMETWCGPCKQAIPTLNKWHARWADAGVSVVITSPENADVLRRYRDANNVDVRMAVDVDRQFQRRFEVEVYPTYIVLDREGNARGQFRGTDNLPKVEALFTSLVDGPSVPDGIRF
jgi:thiol-disulfide isomerase/thioredoxin